MTPGRAGTCGHTGRGGADWHAERIDKPVKTSAKRIDCRMFIPLIRFGGRGTARPRRRLQIGRALRLRGRRRNGRAFVIGPGGE